MTYGLPCMKRVCVNFRNKDGVIGYLPWSPGDWLQAETAEEWPDIRKPETALGVCYWLRCKSHYFNLYSWPVKGKNNRQRCSFYILLIQYSKIAPTVLPIHSERAFYKCSSITAPFISQWQFLGPQLPCYIEGVLYCLLIWECSFEGWVRQIEDFIWLFVNRNKTHICKTVYWNFFANTLSYAVPFCWLRWSKNRRESYIVISVSLLAAF